MAFGFNLLSFLLILTPVVFFHELGHYWAARRSGVRVEVFSVGFGAELFGFTDRHNTRWKFSLIPLGGYVKMAGDEDAASTPSANGEGVKDGFHHASLGRKAFIVGMGPIANFILGILLIASIYVAVGKVVVPTVVGDIQAGSAAARAGIEAGDEIIGANGYKINDFSDLRGHILENPGQSLLLTINRGGRIFDIEAVPDRVEDKCLRVDFGRLGIVSGQGKLEQLSVSSSLWTASVDAFDMSFAMLRGLGRLVSGNSNQGEIGGPVKIAELSGRVTEQGIVSFVMFMAILSINLGLVNLLPIPALDGGHLLFFGLEAAFRRPVSPKIQQILMRLGMAALLSLIVVVTFFDISSLFLAEC